MGKPACCCCNCNNLLENIPGVSKIPVGDEFSDEVLVWDAIAYIYGISAEEFQNISTHYTKTQSDPDSEDLSDAGVLLCDSCSPLFSENYKSHKLLQRSTHPASLVEQVKKYRSGESQLAIKAAEKVKNGEFHSHFVAEDSNSSSAEHDDNLFEDFNFDGEGETGSPEPEEKIETKYEPRAKRSKRRKIEQPSQLQKRTSGLKNVVIKLEKLSSEQLNIEYGIIKQENTDSVNTRDVRSARKKKGSKKKIFRKRESKTARHRRKQQDLEAKPKKVKEDICFKGPQKCEFCEKVFSNRKNRQKHEMTHKRPQEFTCPDCGKLCCSRTHLKNHKLRHASEEEKAKLKTPCPICGKLIFPRNVTQHMNRHSSTYVPQHYTCPTCQKVFTSHGLHKEHLLTHKEGFTPHLCPQCGKAYDTKTSLINHEKTHLERKFACEICSKKFGNLNLLARHQEWHSTENKYVCEECGKGFRVKQCFLTHKRLHKEMAEKGEGSFQCQVCQKFFRHSLSLYKHRTREHGDASKKKIFECSFCGKRLYDAKNLGLHEDLHRKDPGYQPRKDMVRGKRNSVPAAAACNPNPGALAESPTLPTSFHLNLTNDQAMNLSYANFIYKDFHQGSQ